MDERFGFDLDLGFIADEEGRRWAGPSSRPDFRAIRRQDISPRELDLSLVAGRANLVQAILLRLKTEQGELAPLGYPGYGSRHLALVGEPNTERTRNLIKLYVLECLRQEPRIASVVRIVVRPAPGRDGRDKVDIDLTVEAAGIPGRINLVVPFSLLES